MDKISREESNKNKCIELINDINLKHEQSIMSVDTNFNGGMLSRDQILNQLNHIQEKVIENSAQNKLTVGKIYQTEMDTI